MNTSNLKLALILQTHSYEKWHLAGTLAATTVAAGGEAHLFLAQEALLKYLDSSMDEASPSFQSQDLNEKYIHFLEDGKIPKPGSLFKKAKELGNIKIYGCSESVKLFHLESKLTQKLDAILGYTTFLDIASDAKLIVI